MTARQLVDYILTATGSHGLDPDTPILLEGVDALHRLAVSVGTGGTLVLSAGGRAEDPATGRLNLSLLAAARSQGDSE
jgi:hypothetical protein